MPMFLQRYLWHSSASSRAAFSAAKVERALKVSGVICAAIAYSQNNAGVSMPRYVAASSNERRGSMGSLHTSSPVP
jgi:hypothetical protein